MGWNYVFISNCVELRNGQLNPFYTLYIIYICDNDYFSVLRFKLIHVIKRAPEFSQQNVATPFYIAENKLY